MKAGELEAALKAARTTATQEVDAKLANASFLVRGYSSTIHEWINDVLPAVVQDALQAGENWRKAREDKKP